MYTGERSDNELLNLNGKTWCFATRHLEGPHGGLGSLFTGAFVKVPTLTLSMINLTAEQS